MTNPTIYSGSERILKAGVFCTLLDLTLTTVSIKAHLHESMTCGVCSVYRIISAVSEHVVTQHALAGCYQGIRIEESADFGIVITGL